MAEWTTAFLSGVSAEFRGFRLALKQLLEEKGCHVVNQDSFGTDWRTVEAKLRDEIGRSRDRPRSVPRVTASARSPRARHIMATTPGVISSPDDAAPGRSAAAVLCPSAKKEGRAFAQVLP